MKESGAQSFCAPLCFGTRAAGRGLSFILRGALACGYGVIYVVVLAVQRKPKCFAEIAETNVAKVLLGLLLG